MNTRNLAIERPSVSDNTIKVPDRNHPIVMERNSKRIVVIFAGKLLADTCRALTLHEGVQPAVHYIHRLDVHMEALEPSPTTSYCPYKGEASHFHINAGGIRLADAAWTYRTPYWAVAEIENYLAFDLDRIEIAGAQPTNQRDLTVWT